MPKISALPATPGLTLSAIFPEVQPASGGTTYRASLTNLFDLYKANAAALTKVDDTNVTLTLGGSPATALFNATSLTLGWTGTLAPSRGGTGTGSAFTQGSVVFAGPSGNYAQDNANLFFNDTTNRLGVGTTAPRGTLGVVGNINDFQIVANDVSTDATIKNFRFGMGHYTNAQAPLTMLFSSIDGTDAVVNVGGGTGFGNASTEVDVYCAATTTTALGTLITKTKVTGFEVVSGFLRLTPQTASTAVYLDANKNLVSQALTNGQLQIGSTGAIPVAASLTAGTGVSITNGAGSITVNATGGGVTWNDVTATSAAMAVNNGYISNNAGLVTLTLPVSAAVGSVFHIRGLGTGGWSIAQNASQEIKVGNVGTTAGVGGSVASTNRYDCIDLTCVVANLVFVANGVQGILTVV